MPSPLRHCGLDFGTSNTTLGVADGEGARLVPLEDGRVTGEEPAAPAAVIEETAAPAAGVHALVVEHGNFEFRVHRIRSIPPGA